MRRRRTGGGGGKAQKKKGKKKRDGRDCRAMCLHNRRCSRRHTSSGKEQWCGGTKRQPLFGASCCAVGVPPALYPTFDWVRVRGRTKPLWGAGGRADRNSQTSTEARSACARGSLKIQRDSRDCNATNTQSQRRTVKCVSHERDEKGAQTERVGIGGKHTCAVFGASTRAHAARCGTDNGQRRSSPLGAA